MLAMNSAECRRRVAYLPSEYTALSGLTSFSMYPASSSLNNPNMDCHIFIVKPLKPVSSTHHSLWQVPHLFKKKMPWEWVGWARVRILLVQDAILHGGGNLAAKLEDIWNSILRYEGELYRAILSEHVSISKKPMPYPFKYKVFTVTPYPSC